MTAEFLTDVLSQREAMPDNRSRTNDTMSWILSLVIIDYADAAGTQMLEGVIIPLLPEASGPFACATTGFVLGRAFDSVRGILCGHTSCPLRDYALGLFEGWVAQFVYQSQPSPQIRADIAMYQWDRVLGRASSD